MKALIALPVLTDWIGEKCIESIDPAFRQDIILVDNTPNRFGQKFKDEVQLHDNMGVNVGLPSAWNICIRETIRQEADYLIMLSASEVFEHGLRDLMLYLQANKPQWGCTTGRPAWHCVVLSRQCLETVGLFDENFQPAYEEDTDYLRRMQMARIHDRFDESVRLPDMQVSAHSQGNSLSKEVGGINPDHDAHKAYYIRKWGGWVGEETYHHPYNEDELSIKQWRLGA